MRYIRDPRKIIDPNVPLELLYTGDFGGKQRCSFATSVYLITPDNQYIVLHQTKSNRVVGENVVGIGGKAMFDTYFGKSDGEKISSEVLLSSLLSGKLSAGDIDETAIREVFEETGGYRKDGSLSGYGILLDKSKLNRVGQSQVRTINERGDYFWAIQYYVYFLDGTEGEISPEEQREGFFTKHSYDELMMLNMLPAERVILQNSNPNIFVEAIYDEKYKIHKMRTVLEQDNKLISVLVPNLGMQAFIARECDVVELTDEVLKRHGIYFNDPNTLENPDIKRYFEKKYGYSEPKIFLYPTDSSSDIKFEDTPYCNLTPFKTGKNISAPHK